MSAARRPPTHDRHVHMSHVKEHLLRAQRHAALIHGRDVVLHPDSSVPPNRPAAPSYPRDFPPDGGAAGSTAVAQE